ncbi:MAG TPA: hypothetical protein VIS09_09640 [Streptomyces sp.]
MGPQGSVAAAAGVASSSRVISSADPATPAEIEDPATMTPGK